MNGICAPCAYADEHGWWGPGHPGTHCRSCHRSWAGLARAHCMVCHETFSTTGVANRHWSRGVRHRDPETVPAIRRCDDGIWRTAKERPERWGRAAA